MTTPDIAAIAKGLTEAQRRAVLALYPNGATRDCHDRSYISALPRIKSKGLADWHWSPFPRTRPWSLTPLGQQVRAYLEQCRND